MGVKKVVWCGLDVVWGGLVVVWGVLGWFGVFPRTGNESSKFCGLKNLGQSLVLENGTAN